MLRINQNASAAGAKDYYSTADYYTEGQELQGVWRGLAAERLGLRGTIDKAQWEALCDNLDPATGRTLTARNKANRTVGYDFNFHAPKSLSLLHALTGDERLMDAFRGAVDDTMREMEREIKTRVRAGGRDEDRTAGNALWGEFVHLTSRPVGGVPDPHLHAHCFVFNAVYDPVENRFKAGNFKDLKQSAPYFEAVFHADLAHRIAELGLPVERTRNGWEIGGIDRSTLNGFSRRTVQIEREARKKGITSAEEKAELGAKTRERKAKNLTAGELKAEWRSRLTDAETRAFESLAERIGGSPLPRDEPSAARDAVHLSAEHCFERQSVAPERTLLREALRRAYGQAPRSAVEAEAARHPDLIRGDWEGRRSLTTRDVLAEEQAVIRFAREGRGTCAAFGAGAPHTFARGWLNEGQKRAVRHVLECQDRVMIVRGAAGTGKTTMMSEAVAAIEGRGKRVVTVAPSASASRGQLRKEGFDEADTLARFLVDPAMQERARGNLVLVDEAGLVGVRTMNRLFDLSGRLDFRVVLVGDRHQHGPVERGAALALLETDAGLVPAQLTEVRRQDGEYRRAVEHLSAGRVTAGFQILDKLGWVKQVPDDQRYRALADEYIASAVAGRETLVISPSHVECDKTSEAIRLGLCQAGLLGREERTVDVLVPVGLTTAERREARNYESGDVLTFTQNAKGFRKGTRLTVGEDRGTLPLEQAERFTVHRRSQLTLSAGDRVRITANGKTMDGAHALHNGDLSTVVGFSADGDVQLERGRTVGRDFGHLARGYVVTSYTAQSKGVQKAIAAISADSAGATSAKQFYVSASRGKRELTVYTDSKDDLLAAIQRDEDRPSATEFVMGRDHRERALHIQRSASAIAVGMPGAQRSATERHRPVEREA
jgi:conjugative relaxase-like TrwC/TraI family protein